MTKELLHKIKEFAPINNLFTDEEIKVTAEHPYMAVTNPWMDQSCRFELKNSEAVKCWGLVAVTDFIEKATALDKSNPYFIDIIIKLYSLDPDDLETLKNNQFKSSDNNLSIERVVFDYTGDKGLVGYEVRKLLDSENPSYDECRNAFNEMYMHTI